MEAMTDKLMNCPFCGGKANVIEAKHREYQSTYYVYCKHCRCKSMESQCLRDVIEAWNTRKPIDNIVEQLEDANATDDFIQAINGKECNKRERIVCGVALEYALEIVKGVQNEQA